MRVLVVEDEPDLLSSLAQALREEGYAVDTACDGDDGLFKAQNWEYDAIVLDVMLPKLDGWELLKRLRQSKKTPVLMLTARDRSTDRVRGLDTGADDYVVKPFDLAELLARLRALIRRTSNQTTARIEIGDVVLDTAARVVSRSGEPVSLTAREYALLEYLCRKPGAVVSREEIAEHVWDDRYDPCSNVIDVYVQRLRRKLDRGPLSFIRTRRGSGYQLTPLSTSVR